MIELPIEDVVMQFAAIVAAALVVQLAFERTQVPGIIGLIALGMLLGPGGAGVLAQEPVIELFGSIGLLYIMFVAGVEIDLDVVRDRRSEAAIFGMLAFVLSFVPAVGVGLVVGLEPFGALLLGAALSSHTLVSYPTINQMGLARQPAIVAATGGTLLTDTAALVVLVIVTQLAANGGSGSGLGWLTPLLLFGLVAVAALIVIPRLARGVLNSARSTLAEKALFVLTVLLLLAVLADVIGTEEILGAFLAGICLNFALHRQNEVRRHVEFVGRMLFIPFFFVKTGMRLELDVFVEGLEVWLLAVALIAVVLAGKALAAWLVRLKFGYSRLEFQAMAGLTFPQAAATLAVVVIGLEMGLVTPRTADAVIIVIFVTCLIGPLVTGSAARRMRQKRGPRG
jgi:Kef-type K+ transport system membrane component KefB